MNVVTTAEELGIFGKMSHIVVEFTNDHMFERLPWALLSIGIFIGGCVILFFMKRMFSCCCLHPKYRHNWVLRRTHKLPNGRVQGEWIQESHHPMGSFKHLFIEVFFLICLVLIIWVSAHVAGFSFWSSSLVGVGLGLVGTYMFGAAIQALGSGIFIYMTNKIEENFYIEVDGVEGMVRELHPLYAELEYKDKESGGMVYIQVPMNRLLTSIVKRNFSKEGAHKPMNPNELMTKRH